MTGSRCLKTTWPRLDDVLRGRIDRCTMDGLVRMLAAIGRHVTLSVDQAA
jgi:predicted XRE-type DNA-binding protein